MKNKSVTYTSKTSEDFIFKRMVEEKANTKSENKDSFGELRKLLADLKTVEVSTTTLTETVPSAPVADTFKGKNQYYFCRCISSLTNKLTLLFNVE
jgi:hypothetical protein